MRTVVPVDVQGEGAAQAEYTSVMAVEDARLLFISGKVPVTGDGTSLGGKTPEIQMRQAFRNLESALSQSGASLSGVVKLTGFLTSVDHFSVWKKVRSEFFQDPFPACTAVVVTSLADPKWVLEVEAVAAL